MNDNQFLFNYDQNNNYEIFQQEEIQQVKENQDEYISEVPINKPIEPQELRQENISIEPEPIEINDLIVIGAGWSGLLACKYAKENGLNVVVLEGRENIGGVWKFSEDPEILLQLKMLILHLLKLLPKCQTTLCQKNTHLFLVIKKFSLI